MSEYFSDTQAFRDSMDSWLTRGPEDDSDGPTVEGVAVVFEDFRVAYSGTSGESAEYVIEGPRGPMTLEAFAAETDLTFEAAERAIARAIDADIMRQAEASVPGDEEDGVPW